MYPPVALEFKIKLSLSELFGQKWRNADKSDLAVSQFYEESDSRGVSERDVCEFEG
jgi:hypothetical protein